MKRHPVTQVAADVDAYELVKAYGYTQALQHVALMKESDTVAWHYWSAVEAEISRLQVYPQESTHEPPPIVVDSPDAGGGVERE